MYFGLVEHLKQIEVLAVFTDGVHLVSRVCNSHSVPLAALALQAGSSGGLGAAERCSRTSAAPGGPGGGPGGGPAGNGWRLDLVCGSLVERTVWMAFGQGHRVFPEYLTS